MAYQGKIAPLMIVQASREDVSVPYGIDASSQGGAINKKTLRSVDPLLQYTNNLLPFACRSGWDWWPDAATHRVIGYFEDGSIRKDTFGTGTFATTLATGVTVAATKTIQFVEAGKEVAANARKLFMFMGPDTAPAFLSGDGATTSAFTATAADWAAATDKPTCGALHSSRLWAAGNANDPHRVYYSTTTNHSDFTGAGSGSLSIFPGEGQRIVALASFRGLLVVWKYPFGVYLVDTTDPTITNWKIARVTLDVGGVSPNGWCMVENRIVFINLHGHLFSLEAVQDFGSVAINDLTALAGQENFTWQQFSFLPSKLKVANLVYFGPRKEVHIMTYQTNYLIMDLNDERPRLITGPNNLWGSIWNAILADFTPVYFTNTTVRGYSGGLLYGQSGTYLRPFVFFSLDQGDLSFIDPAIAFKRVSPQFLELVVVHSYGLAQNFTVKLYWDNTLTDTKTFTSNPSLPVQQLKMRTTGGGKTLLITIETADSNNYMEIRAINLFFTLADERNI